MKTENLKFVVCEKTKELFRRSRSNPEVFLKISPWTSGEDRRRSLLEIQELIRCGAKAVSKQEAAQLNNQYWYDHSSEWVHSGEKYKTLSGDESGATLLTKLPQKREEIHRYTDAEGFERSWTLNHYLCSYHGKLYWAIPYAGYWPRVNIYEYMKQDSPDINPFDPAQTCGYSGQWTDAKNLKVIYHFNPNTKTWENI
jgi:hypothetical protein